MEQLHQPQPLVELHQRRHRRWWKPPYARRTAGAVRRAEAVAGEQRDDPGRQLGIGEPGQRSQRRHRRAAAGVGHVQPTVLGEPGEQDLVEGMGDRRRPRDRGY